MVRLRHLRLLATFIAANFFPSGNEAAGLGSLGFAFLAYPLFLALNSGSVGAAIAAHCGLAAIEAVYVSAAVTAGVEFLTTRVRYSEFSIGYNISVAALGGTTPYVVTWLTAHTGSKVTAAFYLMAAAVISFVTVLTRRETAAPHLVARHAKW